MYAMVEFLTIRLRAGRLSGGVFLVRERRARAFLQSKTFARGDCFYSGGRGAQRMAGRCSALLGSGSPRRQLWPVRKARQATICRCIRLSGVAAIPQATAVLICMAGWVRGLLRSSYGGGGCVGWVGGHGAALPQWRCGR